MHEHKWLHSVSTDGTQLRRCSGCGEEQRTHGGLPPGFPSPAEVARLFTDSMRGSVSAFGALRESVEAVKPSEMFSVYYPPEISEVDGTVSETLKAQITPEEALQVILDDITADMLVGPEAVRERAARWVTELTTKAARIVKTSEGEDDGR